MNHTDNIKVLVISHMYPNKLDPTNGIFIHNQTKYLFKAGCNVKVISPIPYAPKILWSNPKWRRYGQAPNFDTIDEVPVYYPRYINLPGTWFRRLAYWSNYIGIRNKIDKIIQSFKPDVIHAHTATPSGYVALMLSRRYRVPLVCSLRGSDINVYPHYDRLTMFFTKKVISESNRIVSVSNALKIAAEKIAAPREAIKVIYNGCDLNTFSFNSEHRQMIRNKMNVSEKVKVITFIGGLKKTKGVFELIDAFDRLLLQHPSIHLFIIGDGPEYDSIKKVIFSKSLDDKIHLVGNKPHSDISNWLSASDIFVLPTYYEGLPNIVLEAMACSLPVVVTGVGGVPEIIDNKVNGILLESKNVDVLINAIEFVLENKQYAKKMGIAGRNKIESIFSWQRNTMESIQIYKEALSHQ